MRQVLISVGSNINREFHIRAGVKALKTLDSSLRCSRVFEAVPVGFEGDNFYNLVVELHTQLSLEEIAQSLRDIEAQFHRDRHGKKFSDRTLDLDLLTYGDLCQTDSPSLPRKDIYIFAFTLLPLAELCPDQTIPGDNKTYYEAWQQFDKNQELWVVSGFDFS